MTDVMDHGCFTTKFFKSIQDPGNVMVIINVVNVNRFDENGFIEAHPCFFKCMAIISQNGKATLSQIDTEEIICHKWSVLGLEPKCYKRQVMPQEAIGIRWMIGPSQIGIRLRYFVHVCIKAMVRRRLFKQHVSTVRTVHKTVLIQWIHGEFT
jgi:hypothetical protein